MLAGAPAGPAPGSGGSAVAAAAGSPQGLLLDVVTEDGQLLQALPADECCPQNERDDTGGWVGEGGGEGGDDDCLQGGRLAVCRGERGGRGGRGCCVCAREGHTPSPPLASTPPVDDLVRSDFLHEPGILHTLRVRYALDSIYTYSGTILIAVSGATQQSPPPIARALSLPCPLHASAASPRLCTPPPQLNPPPPLSSTRPPPPPRARPTPTSACARCTARA